MIEIIRDWIKQMRRIFSKNEAIMEAKLWTSIFLLIFVREIDIKCLISFWDTSTYYQHFWILRFPDPKVFFQNYIDREYEVKIFYTLQNY